MKNKKLWLAGGVLVVLALAVFHGSLLAAAGTFLVNSDAPHKADIVVVLAGDARGNRILTGAQLVREGYAGKVLVSGPYGAYGNFESDLAISFAEKQGFPAAYFEGLRHHALSTKEEAAVIVPELRRLRVTTVLLVTSDYHTRRAGKLFRAAAPDLKFYVIAAPDEYFSAREWWQVREGRKIFAIESMKTVAEWLGL